MKDYLSKEVDNFYINTEKTIYKDIILFLQDLYNLDKKISLVAISGSHNTATSTLFEHNSKKLINPIFLGPRIIQLMLLYKHIQFSINSSDPKTIIENGNKSRHLRFYSKYVNIFEFSENVVHKSKSKNIWQFQDIMVLRDKIANYACETTIFTSDKKSKTIRLQSCFEDSGFVKSIVLLRYIAENHKENFPRLKIKLTK